MTRSTTQPPPSVRVTDGPLLDLHDALMAAPEVGAEPAAGRRPRTVVRYLAAAVVIAVLGVGGALVATQTDNRTAAADVKVTKHGGTITVTVSKEVSVEQLRTELARAGVKVGVEGVPTGPSQINAFVGIVGPPDAILPTAGFRKPIATFRAGSKVVLRLGVRAEPGQTYGSFPSATNPGEPLAGLDIAGRPLAEVRDLIEAAAVTRGVSVSYRSNSGQPTTAPDPAARVVSAISLASDKIAVLVG